MRSGGVHTLGVAEPRAANTGEKDAAPATGTQGRSKGGVRSHVPADIRNVSFPASMRGYDRAAVEAYVRRVNRVIAELEVTRSPQAAVKHAVERVSEQTKAILEEARESAEQITATARAEGDEILARAKAEAAELVVNASAEADRVRAEAEQLIAGAKAEAERIVGAANAEAAERRRQSDDELASLQEQAEAKMRELEADTATVWKERHELLGDIDRMASRLHEAASAAAARFSDEGGDKVADEAAPATEAEQTAVLPAAPTVAEPPARRRSRKT
jgi:DivIVA domain-containing protein